MNDLIVKSVDVLGDAIMAMRDTDGQIWAGVSYFCRALGMNKGQKDRQTTNVQKDETLKRGCRKFAAGVFDPTNEAVGMRIDFVPLWLAKINITKTMLQDHPELADKLLEYQLKAKDILAAAFLPQQDAEPKTPTELLKMHYEAIKFVESKVDGVSERVNELDSKLDSALLDLPILGVEESKINKAVKKKGVEVMGGKESNAYRNRSIVNSVYRDIYGQIYRNFGVSTYKALKRNQCEKVLEVIRRYVPPVILADRIQNENAQNSLDLEGGAYNG